MNPSTLSRLVRPLLAAMLLLAFSGCVSSRYRKARENTPPPQLFNVAFAPAPLEAALITLITYNGPGSWKRDAFWDEYVVTLRNPGKEPLTISTANLVDYAGTGQAPGLEPWILEKQSKTSEQKYKEAGIAFVRYTAPGLVILGAGVAVVAANTSIVLFGPAAGTAGTAAASTAAAATLVALPIYYAVVLTINHHNKQAMETEFNRRRLALPLTLAPGETRTGSLFFPMTPNPRSLTLGWSTASATGDCTLPLDFLRGLHVAPATTK